ncbi:MAG: DUF805 domain-containing protein [Proteobacteria bacterium]|nr:DUF805 domain-containing protein [Pseudomonadota bacterium]
MTFGKAWNNFWIKQLNITDRATRPEFWLMFPIFFALPYLLSKYGYYIYMLSKYMFHVSPHDWLSVYKAIYGFFLIVTFIPFMTISARRFNDIGLPAWVPILVIGVHNGMSILSVFNLPNYMWDYAWLAYIFVMGACLAPSASRKK